MRMPPHTSQKYILAFHTRVSIQRNSKWVNCSLTWITSLSLRRARSSQLHVSSGLKSREEPYHGRKIVDPRPVMFTGVGDSSSSSALSAGEALQSSVPRRHHVVNSVNWRGMAIRQLARRWATVGKGGISCCSTKNMSRLNKRHPKYVVWTHKKDRSNLQQSSRALCRTLKTGRHTSPPCSSMALITIVLLRLTGNRLSIMETSKSHTVDAARLSAETSNSQNRKR